MKDYDVAIYKQKFTELYLGLYKEKNNKKLKCIHYGKKFIKM